MRKIIIFTVFIILFFIGIIALTQEVPIIENITPSLEVQNLGETENNDNGNILIENLDSSFFAAGTRWFRSNAGGMALEEIYSRYAALRNEYALLIDYIDITELPEILLEYYNHEYFIEIRTLYENGIEKRTQWIFLDNNNTARMTAVFQNIEEEEENGFIEIYDGNAFLITEINFLEDGSKNKTEHRYRDGIKISSDFYLWGDSKDDFEIIHTDRFFYNRSMFLRSVERTFYSELDHVKFSFPMNIFHAALNDNFIKEILNPLPEYLENISTLEDDKMETLTDERGRILTQTFYDDEGNIIWTVQNTWQDDRIITVRKTEDDTEFLAEYEYDADGNRILEKNSRDGVLERIVRTEGNIDIEELIFNNVVVMQAIWEDGRKISETRVVP